VHSYASVQILLDTTPACIQMQGGAFPPVPFIE
jgi:hypothetical protein